MTNDVSTSRTLSRLLGTEIPADALTADQVAYLDGNLHRLDSVEKIWAAMDDVWEAEGAGFSDADAPALGRFYAHPVWLLNGIFTENDPESRSHRLAIADFVEAAQPSLVIDYGGGFGALARVIATRLPSADVRVLDPWPQKLAMHLAARHPNLRYESMLPNDVDIIIAQDVLEHVTDPLSVFETLLAHVRVGGVVVAANCFQPVIRCHYPGALHFHFTFPAIASRLGCCIEGGLPGAPHAHVFRKTAARPNMRAARALERMSQISFPLLLRLQKLKRALLGPN